MANNRRVEDLPLGLMGGVDKNVIDAYLEEGEFGQGVLVGMNLMRGLTAEYILKGRLKTGGIINLDLDIGYELALWSKGLGVRVRY